MEDYKLKISDIISKNSNNIISKMKLIGEIMPIINEMEKLDNQQFNPLIKQLREIIEDYFTPRSQNP